ncbi:hypothetical protein [Shimia haliotis]|uniref:Antitoxin CcdA n=1 Tax=Shimia haliotis TaxID=1280847 RepID=A0A1I4CAQ7_9RHOB|nr:hypothetical protein [Shimia haliotis]SFK77131.1 antitoxin CcdA [Shimia haliotis]
MAKKTMRMTSPMPDGASVERAPEVNEDERKFAEQADWHDRHGHPLAEIFAGPGGSSWNR